MLGPRHVALQKVYRLRLAFLAHRALHGLREGAVGDPVELDGIQVGEHLCFLRSDLGELGLRRGHSVAMFLVHTSNDSKGRMHVMDRFKEREYCR